MDKVSKKEIMIQADWNLRTSAGRGGEEEKSQKRSPERLEGRRVTNNSQYYAEFMRK